jgi:predicted Zn-dependent protease
MNPTAIADQLVGLVKQRAPGAESIVSVELGRTGHTRFACNEITTAGEVEVSRVRVVLARGGRHAAATHTRTDSRALVELVDRAAEIVAMAPEDPEWLEVLGPRAFAAPGRTFDEATLATSPEVRATAVKKAIAVAEGRGMIGAGSYTTRGSVLALATTAGLLAVHHATAARLTMTVRSGDATGSGWAGADEVAADDVDPIAIADIATDKALRSRQPSRAEPGPWRVILEPACVADLLRFLLEALDTRGADEGRSFFSKRGGGSRVGEKMFADGLTLRCDPFSTMTPAAPFDRQGLPVEPVSYVENGTLRALVTSRFWARKTATRPTAFPSAVHLLGGKTRSIDELVGMTERGLYISRFWYTRWLDPRDMTVTGVTRDGVFLIEDGRVAHPVNNFRFNQSLAAVLANAKAWTQDTSRVPSPETLVRVPALLTDDFHMTSISTAT